MALVSRRLLPSDDMRNSSTARTRASPTRRCLLRCSPFARADVLDRWPAAVQEYAFRPRFPRESGVSGQETLRVAPPVVDVGVLPLVAYTGQWHRRPSPVARRVSRCGFGRGTGVTPSGILGSYGAGIRRGIGDSCSGSLFIVGRSRLARQRGVRSMDPGAYMHRAWRRLPRLRASRRARPRSSRRELLIERARGAILDGQRNVLS